MVGLGFILGLAGWIRLVVRILRVQNFRVGLPRLCDRFNGQVWINFYDRHEYNDAFLLDRSMIVCAALAFKRIVINCLLTP